MRYQQLTALLTLFSREGIFYNFKTQTLLEDPVIIPEHPDPKLRDKIFSNQHWQSKFTEITENVARIEQLTAYIDQAQYLVNFLTFLQISARRRNPAGSDHDDNDNDNNDNEPVVQNRLDAISNDIARWVSEISCLSETLAITLADGTIQQLRANQAACPISRHIITREQLVCAKFFQLMCAVLVQRILQLCWLPNAPSLAELAQRHGVGVIAEPVQQGYQLLSEYLAAATAEHIATANLAVDKIIRQQAVEPNLLHPLLYQYLGNLLQGCSVEDLVSLQQNLPINIEVIEQVKLIEAEETEITLGAAPSSNSLDIESNSYSGYIMSPVKSSLSANSQQVDYQSLTDSFSLRTANIKIIEPYSGLRIPAVPVVLPYDPVCELKDNRHILDEVVIFPLAVQFQLNNPSELPPAIRFFLQRLNLNIFTQAMEGNFFVSMQSKPKNWQVRNESLLLRPQPWLHAEANNTVNNMSNTSIVLAAIAESNSKFKPPALVEGICTHKGNNKNDGLVFSNKQLRICGLDNNITNSFYSICLEYDEKTATFNRVAITLHVLLTDNDAEVLHTAIAICQTTKLAGNEITLENLMVALADNNDAELAHTIPLHELRSFISANWQPSSLKEVSTCLLVEQELRTHQEILSAQELNYAIGSTESSIINLSMQQSNLIAAIKKQYGAQFSKMGGTSAVLDDFRNYLLTKIAAEDPELPVEVTHDNLEYINQTILAGQVVLATKDKTIEQLNYEYVEYLHKHDSEKFKRYLKPHFVALRYFALRNYFMHPKAAYQVQEEITLPGTNTKMTRAYRSEFNAELLEDLAYFWLAAADQDAQPTEIEYTIDSRKEAFVLGINQLARAHNYDPDFENEESAAVDVSTTKQRSKEHDNCGLDRPTCARGVCSRLTTILIAHPLLEREDTIDIMADVRLNFVEFITERFKQFIETYYEAHQLRASYEAAAAYWVNAEFVDTDDTYEILLANSGSKCEKNSAYEQHKFLINFQELMQHAIELFNQQLSIKYGATALQRQPKAADIEKCVEFGVTKLDFSKITFASYVQFFKFVSKVFWVEKPNKNGVWVNKAIAQYLATRFAGLIKARVNHLTEINKTDMHANTLLHYACLFINIEKIAKLLQDGCDMEAKNAAGKKAEDYILSEGYQTAIKEHVMELFMREKRHREKAFENLLKQIMHASIQIGNEQINHLRQRIRYFPGSVEASYLVRQNNVRGGVSNRTILRVRQNNIVNEISAFVNRLETIRGLIVTYRRRVIEFDNISREHRQTVNILVLNLRVVARVIRAISLEYGLSPLVDRINVLLTDCYYRFGDFFAMQISSVDSGAEADVDAEDVDAEDYHADGNALNDTAGDGYTDSFIDEILAVASVNQDRDGMEQIMLRSIVQLQQQINDEINNLREQIQPYLSVERAAAIIDTENNIAPAYDQLIFSATNRLAATRYASLCSNNIYGINPYSRMLYLPNAPIILPYHINGRIMANRRFDHGLARFAVTYLYRPFATVNLPDGVLELVTRELRTRFNVDHINREHYDVYIVMQNQPWQNEPLTLRAHPWCHTSAPARGEIRLNSTCLVAIAAIGGEFSRFVEGEVFTQSYGASEVLFGPNNFVINDSQQPNGLLDFNETHIMFSICINLETRRVAITCHCLLNDTDLAIVDRLVRSSNIHVITDLLTALAQENITFELDGLRYLILGENLPNSYNSLYNRNLRDRYSVLSSSNMQAYPRIITNDNSTPFLSLFNSNARTVANVAANVAESVPDNVPVNVAENVAANELSASTSNQDQNQVPTSASVPARFASRS